MPKVRRKRIASRGSVNNIILEALNEGDKYGYEIIKQVEEKTNGEIKLKQPSLYSSLTRLEQKGYISSYWGGSDIGGRRHYYYITKVGRHYYNTVILKLEVQQSEEELDAIEQAAQIKRQQIMNECNTTKIVEEDNTVYVPKKIQSPIIPVQYDVDDSVKNIELSATHNAEDMVIVHSDEHNNTTVEATTNESPTINENITPKKDYVLEALLKIIRNNNHKFAQKSRVLKPTPPTPIIKKKQIMVKDVDGIYKLRDEEYNPYANMYHHSNRPRVVDNVIKRRDINVVDYPVKQQSTTTPTHDNHQVEQLSQQEKEERNRKFANKFDEITNKIILEREREKAESTNNDYRSKLDMLSNTYDSSVYDEDEDETYIPRNPEYYNVTLEKGEDPFADDYMAEDDEEFESDQLSDDKFIDFEEETAPSQPKYESRYEPTEDNQPNIKGYKEFRASTTQHSNMNFVKVNKAKFLFGFVMVLLMILEVTTTFFIIKSTNNYYDKDMYMYVIAYAIIGVFALLFLAPYLFNQDKKALQTFKFKYSVMFGCLTFLILTILVYAFNSLAGFDANNVAYFVSTLSVPIVLASNFAIYPFVYNFVLKIKSLY